MKTRRAIPLALLGAGILSLTAACGDEGDSESGAAGGDGAVEQGGTVVIADIADVNLPVALFANSVLDGTLSTDVLNREMVRGGWEDGRLVHKFADQHPMALARRVEYLGADSTALRFHMRSDALWSDGRPVTAHDVVFTYELAKNPAVASPRADYVANLDSVVAQSDSTVTFFYARRYPEMLAHTAIPPLPRHVFQDANPAEIRTHPAFRDLTTLPTSGPYRFGERRPGETFTLVPNPHFQPRPNLDQVVFRIIPDPTTRVVELQTGNVDFVQNVPSDQIARLRAQAQNLRFEQEERRYYDYIAYNPKGFAAFADPEIRRAMGMALNVPQIIQAIELEDYAEPAGGPVPPVLSDLYEPSQAPPLSFDTARAKQILEAKGWRDTDGDGIRDKGGQPFRFTLVTNAGNQRRADVSTVAQQQWRRIGVDVELQTLEFNTFQQQVLLGRDYQAAVGGWGIGLTPDYLAVQWGADSPYNLSGYSDPAVTRLIEQARSARSAAEATPLWKQVAARVAAAQPVTFLYFMDAVDGVNERVRGVEINTYGPYQNLHEWWIPASQRRAGGPAAPAATPPADTAAR